MWMSDEEMEKIEKECIDRVVQCAFGGRRNNTDFVMMKYWGKVRKDCEYKGGDVIESPTVQQAREYLRGTRKF